MSTSEYQSELAAERAYLLGLHAKLDTEHALAVRELKRTLHDTTAGDPEARWHRQVSAERLGARVHALRVAENGLCFGRIDDADGTATYVGRIGLFDEDNDHRPMLVDWRAPAARGFYCATAINPEGLVRRRHFRVDGRALVTFHDDPLRTEPNGGDAALLAALNAPRDGRMHDIVATIQTEQDEIIRLPDLGTVVIEGGPGTGKTAIALHRVAYLLYTHRDRLSRRGVLVIGPNAGFLDYIGTVLPSLGETSVVFSAVGELVPGSRVSAEDGPRAKRVKGALGMVEILAAAVADRQELPEHPIPIELDDVEIAVDAPLAAGARQRARASGLPHNDAREVFHHHLVEALVERAVERIGAGWLGEADLALRRDLAAEVRVELTGHARVRQALEALWPRLTPRSLLADFYSCPARIAAATPGMDERDRAALYREDGASWTVSDVPLLDEAVEFLGTDRSAEEPAQRQRRHDAEYARGVLDILDTGAEDDEEVLRAVDLVDAEFLSERHVERDGRDLAARAAEDREWTYGHVVVDEAQELSALDWLVVMRRCPSKSATIVGDLAQRRSAAGAHTWQDMLGTYVERRWTYRSLSINYRTPAEIMAVASRVLALVDPAATPPESVRCTGHRPSARGVEPDGLAAAVSEALHEAPGEGTRAVIAPGDLELDVDAPVFTPSGAKGWEFDVVVLVEPQRILGADNGGAAELYVALTRATQHMIVLYSGPLPDVLAELRPGTRPPG